MKYIEATCVSRRIRLKDSLILSKDMSKQKTSSDLKYSLHTDIEEENSYRTLEEAGSCVTAGEKGFQNILKGH